MACLKKLLGVENLTMESIPEEAMAHFSISICCDGFKYDSKNCLSIIPEMERKKKTGE